MPALAPDQCYRAIKPVDIGPTLAVMDKLDFFAAGLSSPKMYKCDVALNLPLEMEQLLDDLELGGKLARAVARRLAPRQSIPPHIDDWMPKEKDWRRFQVPLITDASVVMRWPDDGQETHLMAGWLYEVRFDRTHEVINEWDGERVHLQIDQVDATI